MPLRTTAYRPWKEYEKFAFRVAFIFFISLSIPNSPEWYKHVWSIDWTNLHYRDLYDVARFGSGLNFFGNEIFGSALAGYANWITTLLVSLGLGAVWTVIDRVRKKPEDYNVLYYWLRAIVRYRAGIGIIGFGFTKLLPVQMPYPSTALLNTDFGDFTAQKIYWLSIGIVPWYQVFAGIVEVGAGTMLFFRKTTLLGAALLFGALGDIVYVNFAYDGGVHVYSSYFVLLAGFLIVHYIPALYRLLILEQPAKLVTFYPAFAKPWQQGARIGIKSLTIALFLVVLFYLQLVNFWYDPYKQPSTKGVTALRGYYNVTEFRVNNQPLAYHPLDSLRWSEVTLENWTTLTFKVNKPTDLDLSNGGGDPQRDINRTFELAGVGGGRRAFHYYADTVDQILYLQDKYKAIPDRRNITAGAGGDGGDPDATRLAKKKKPEVKKEGIYADTWISPQAWTHMGDEVTKINAQAASTRRNREFAREKGKYDERKRMVLHYDVERGGARVILRGVDEKQDSVYVVLDRQDKQYALSGSTLSAGDYQ